VHHNTIGHWVRAVDGRGNEQLLKSPVSGNRIDDIVRWAVHELRRLCPQPEIGTRTIGRFLIRPGIRISRSTVQRVLREEMPEPEAEAEEYATEQEDAPDVAKQDDDSGEKTPAKTQLYGVLAPENRNDVWHLDLTTLTFLCFSLSLAAVLDGASRRLLALRLYVGASTSRNLAALVRWAGWRFGYPETLITDHGCQFRERFHRDMRRMKVRHLRSQLPWRGGFLAGKIERFFRTLRVWWRVVLPSLRLTTLQGKLDTFAYWYNHRPHASLGGLTPMEAWNGETLPETVAFLTKDAVKPKITVRRTPCRGDPWLPTIDIKVRWHASRAA